MADPILWPILRPGVPPGSTRQSDIMLYAWRDVRGVEKPAAVPAKRPGFNAEAEWTARAERAFRREHNPETGRHVGPKFPIGWISIGWKSPVATMGQVFFVIGPSILAGEPHETSPIGTLEHDSYGHLTGLRLSRFLGAATFVLDSEFFGVVYRDGSDFIAIETDWQNLPNEQVATLSFTVFPE